MASCPRQWKWTAIHDELIFDSIPSQAIVGQAMHDALERIIMSETIEPGDPCPECARRTAATGGPLGDGVYAMCPASGCGWDGSPADDTDRWTPRCCNPACLGVIISDSDRYGLSVERCDECDRFADDDEAMLWLAHNLHTLTPTERTDMSKTIEPPPPFGAVEYKTVDPSATGPLTPPTSPERPGFLSGIVDRLAAKTEAPRDTAYLVSWWSAEGDARRASGLQSSWFYLPEHVHAFVFREMSGDDCASVADLARASAELQAWLASAVVGDTHNPGYGVVFVACLRLDNNAGDWMEVEDYDEAHATGQPFGPPETPPDPALEDLRYRIYQAARDLRHRAASEGEPTNRLGSEDVAEAYVEAAQTLDNILEGGA